jgi:purine-binding chemotaxis protein CheW
MAVTAALVFVVAGRRCAIPLTHVVEAMRPLPVTPVDDMPPFVRGVAVIRGAAVPVIDPGALLGVPAPQPRRFVTLKAGGRLAAIVVDEVLGLDTFAADSIEARPTVLSQSSAAMIESLARRDQELYLVLDAAWVIGQGNPSA